MGRQNPRRSSKLFRLVLVNNDSHETLQTYRFSKYGLITKAVAIFVVVVGLLYSIIAFTPLRTTIPGYPDAHSKKVALENALKIDSLESVVTRWELYAGNLRSVLSGEKSIKKDSILRTNVLNLLSDKPEEYLRSRDSLLRAQIEDEQQFQLSSVRRELPIDGMHFFTPLKGVIVKNFDLTLHPALDIKAPKGSVVSSIYEGTVVFSGWDDDLGNFIIVQHPSDVISTYEHCEKLLRKTGDKVGAGTPIALVGNTGAGTEGEYLHFALWCKGEAMDPNKFISF